MTKLNEQKGAVSTVVGVVSAISLAFAGYVVSQVNLLSNDIKEVKSTDSGYVQRISAQEATVSGVDKRLERIENKLDQALRYK